VLNLWFLLTILAAAPTAPSAPTPAPVAQTVADPGARAFQRCAACHSVRANAHDDIGPNLRDVFGRRVGAVSGYPYSDSLRAAGRRGMVWNATTLDRFLADPEAAIPGTAMPYQGGSAAERAALIAWLRRTG
tara:strand:- start:2526 stop:2921 length:396 start_codon:yes stop_codon:yes gene_type:complete